VILTMARYASLQAIGLGIMRRKKKWTALTAVHSVLRTMAGVVATPPD
jgi:hypothetical protein